ncbi:MAG: DUF4250 domain-containing protein [Eubacterium sp.]|jgi:hypothetical protein|nr:DUF4250 domain-containing protein [Eubacterium sp.]MBR6218447.1 DUF4250 domain-containing protein [Eubacterium sp.]HBE09546.1 DUF4250 domain-containing protein [Lachnospiraceae bacterium]
MSLPSDPFMLLSYVNTQLRDNYSSLDDLSASCGADKSSIVEKLEKAGYSYNAELNKFIQG